LSESLWELIEWLGFVILCWNLPALTFLPDISQSPQAPHHAGIGKFNYPPERKAIIPFLGDENHLRYWDQAYFGTRGQ
jgi:hypothetical protein